MAEKTRNYYKTSKKWREHEIELATLKAFAADPELKYFMGVAAGAGIATLGGLMKPPTDSSGNIIEGGVNAYEWMLGVGSPLLGALGAFDFNGDANKTLSHVIGLAGGSFAGFCGAVLILKAMSGGQDGAGILGKLTMGIA